MQVQGEESVIWGAYEHTVSMVVHSEVGRLSALEAGWEQAWADEHRTRLLRALDVEWTELFALRH